jgi:hypothetical protein
MPRSATRVAVGRANKAAGTAFEAWVEAQHNAALTMGVLAHIEHNEAHSKIISGRPMYVAPGVADYTGTLANGKSLAAEAKSTDAMRLSKSEVKPLQQKHLNAVARTGAPALLLVEFRGIPVEGVAPGIAGSRRYAVPWMEVPWEVLRTAESVSESALIKWRIQPSECYVTRVCDVRLPPEAREIKRGRIFPRE